MQGRLSRNLVQYSVLGRFPERFQNTRETKIHRSDIMLDNLAFFLNARSYIFSELMIKLDSWTRRKQGQKIEDDRRREGEKEIGRRGLKTAVCSPPPFPPPSPPSPSDMRVGGGGGGKGERGEGGTTNLFLLLPQGRT